MVEASRFTVTGREIWLATGEETAINSDDGVEEMLCHEVMSEVQELIACFEDCMLLAVPANAKIALGNDEWIPMAVLCLPAHAKAGEGHYAMIKEESKQQPKLLQPSTVYYSSKIQHAENHGSNGYLVLVCRRTRVPTSGVAIPFVGCAVQGGAARAHGKQFSDPSEVGGRICES